MTTTEIRHHVLIAALAVAAVACDGGDGDTKGADASVDADADADTDTDTDTDAETDSDTDTGSPDCWEGYILGGHMDPPFCFVGTSSVDGPWLKCMAAGEGTSEDTLATFSISSHSDLGGPTAPGEFPIDDAIAAGTSGLFLEGSQYAPDTPEDPELYYLPVAGTGSFDISAIPAVFDDTAVGQWFSASGSFDMQQADPVTNEPVEGGCYLWNATININTVIQDW
jgi:hypothetical protein